MKGEFWSCTIFEIDNIFFFRLYLYEALLEARAIEKCKCKGSCLDFNLHRPSSVDRRDIFLEEKEDTLSRIRKYRKVSVVQHLNTDCHEGPVGDATNDASECFSIFLSQLGFSLGRKVKDEV